MRLAIITARGGSKRIPRKNIRDFCGKPIICYSIEAALSSGCFDEVMVSTDDDEISGLAKKLGASIPFKRSSQTSSDIATTAEVLLEVLLTYKKKQVDIQLACCIYPTAALLTSHIIKKGLELLLNDNDIKTVMPIVRFSYPVQRALVLRDNRVEFLDSKHSLSRSQDLEAAYHDAGQFYWFRVDKFLDKPALLGDGTAGIIMPEWQVQDIDNEEDWILAEMKYRFMQARKDHPIPQSQAIV